MQSSLDFEVKARVDAVKSKKKLELKLNDIENQFDHAKNSLIDQNNLNKKLQSQIKVRNTVLLSNFIIIQK